MPAQQIGFCLSRFPAPPDRYHVDCGRTMLLQLLVRAGAPDVNDDATLLSHAAGGDARALRTLLERHGPRVWKEIDRGIGAAWQSLIDADDVMQVTYVEAFLQADRITARNSTAFVSWLRSIARNNLRDAIKELARKKRPSPTQRVALSAADSPVGHLEHLAETTTTPSRQAAAGEVQCILSAMLDKLPPDYGRVIRLYDLDGRDIKEVAASMNRSRGAIHMLRARAHDQLRLLLGAEGNFFTHPG